MYHRVWAGPHFNRTAWGTLRAGNWSSMLCPVLAHGPHSLLKRPLSSRLHHTSLTKTRDSTGEVGMSSQTLFSVTCTSQAHLYNDGWDHLGTSLWGFSCLGMVLVTNTSIFSTNKESQGNDYYFLRACWIPAHLDLSLSEQSLKQGLCRLLATKRQSSDLPATHSRWICREAGCTSQSIPFLAWFLGQA